ncbi:MAG: 3-hydroxyacyl-ACP dehydratase FabZ [Gammaproteobacteria bacterium]|nr:3-hydroxyacyl-ACP dehydratase FabZ [Gammaproteobacteria bacterium]
MLTIQEIYQNLPHRFPFLFIDRVLEIVEGEYLKALKNVTVNEAFFVGHLPHFTVMPGALIIEVIAQASLLLASTHPHWKSQVTQAVAGDSVSFLAGVNHARFKSPVTPGDQLIIEVKPLHIRSSLAKCAGQVFVDGKLVAEAEIMCVSKKVR